MKGREQIFLNLRRSLGVTGTEAPRRLAVAQRTAEAPRGVVPARGQLPPDERVALFLDRVIGAQGTVAEVADPGGVPSAIADVLRRHNLAPRLRRGADPRLEAMPWGATTLEVAVGPSDGSDEVAVSHALAGVAETGTAVMVSGPDNPSTLNLLPDLHIVVVHRDDIAPDYETVWERLRARYGAGTLPRTVNWITGPSRSADIEQRLLLGAHGPRRLHVIVVGDGGNPLRGSGVVSEETEEAMADPRANKPAPDPAAAKQERARKSQDYDEAVEDSFPASDPPANAEPGGGITGPNDTPPKRSDG
jgi:L-lactate dehydrogenase complex protein LldG